MTTIINPRRINRTIVVERDSRTLTARVIDALDAPNGMAEMLADAEAARDDAQQAVTDAQVIKDGLLDDLTVTANTLAPGEPATADWDGDTQLLTLGIPEGQPGDVSGMVRFDAAQTLTAPQQAQARDNIDAVAIADLPEVPVEVPLGTIMHFAADTPPGGWLVCDGTPVTALYPDLRAFLVSAGSPYGTSGGNPRLPDLRGEFVRGWDGGRGVDPGRVFGSAQGDAIRNIVGSLGTSRAIEPPASPGAFTSASSALNAAGTGATSSALRSFTFDASRVVPTADENRPRNIALLPCIRAYASVVNVPGQADLDNILQQTRAMADDARDQAIAAIPPPYDPFEGLVWQDVTASRALHTNYQNTTGRPIFISVSAYGGGSSSGYTLYFEIGPTSSGPWVGVSWPDYGAGSSNGNAPVGGWLTIEGILVPPGHYYRVRRASAGAVLHFWSEARA